MLLGLEPCVVLQGLLHGKLQRRADFAGVDVYFGLVRLIAGEIGNGIFLVLEGLVVEQVVDGPLRRDGGCEPPVGALYLGSPIGKRGLPQDYGAGRRTWLPVLLDVDLVKPMAARDGCGFREVDVLDHAFVPILELLRTSYVVDFVVVFSPLEGRLIGRFEDPLQPRAGFGPARLEGWPFGGHQALHFIEQSLCPWDAVGQPSPDQPLKLPTALGGEEELGLHADSVRILILCDVSVLGEVGAPSIDLLPLAGPHEGVVESVKSGLPPVVEPGERVVDPWAHEVFILEGVDPPLVEDPLVRGGLEELL